MYRKRGIGLFIIFITGLALMLVFGVYMDSAFLPSVSAIAEIKARSICSEAIDCAIEKSFSELNLKYDDFFIVSAEDNTFSADTVLINSLCYIVNRNTGEIMERLESEKIHVPVGASSGISIFSDYGPRLNFRIKPYGDAVTDYDTEIVSAGINNVGVKIWLKCETTVRIIHPLTENKITVTRKVMIVDTVIRGKALNSYMGVIDGR